MGVQGAKNDSFAFALLFVPSLLTEVGIGPLSSIPSLSHPRNMFQDPQTQMAPPSTPPTLFFNLPKRQSLSKRSILHRPRIRTHRRILGLGQKTFRLPSPNEGACLMMLHQAGNQDQRCHQDHQDAALLLFATRRLWISGLARSKWLEGLRIRTSWRTRARPSGCTCEALRTWMDISGRCLPCLGPRGTEKGLACDVWGAGENPE
ncbi:hypothetical protein B0T25DRAFT_363708 [Lasiosphaeria hispida]|uniref:Uncharacterized protein n=1 Tax=Lasiosphaeria hispida TaxID=260671 RepID=A0AAJ0H5T0_9PEZI|nr:hypothetical protein B0T25DRAFT_363708 [Lasiosphaeria hispida]